MAKPRNTGGTMAVTPERVYEVWRGRNMFFCGGRIMTGPRINPIVWSLIMMLLPFVLYLSSTDYWVRHRLGTVVPPIVVSIMFVYCLVEFLATAFADPGIIPRSHRNHKHAYRRPRPPRVQFVVASGRHVELQYCDTCELFGPPRSEHCAVCNNCVFVFDHHCPWVGNCIGQRNYPSFFRFLIAICALNALTAAAAVWHGIVELVAGNVTTRGLLSMVLAVYTVAMIPFTWGMAGFHVYLTCRGRTTYEHLSARHQTLPRRESRGCLATCAYLCGGRVPSFVMSSEMLAATTSSANLSRSGELDSDDDGEPPSELAPNRISVRFSDDESDMNTTDSYHGHDEASSDVTTSIDGHGRTSSIGGGSSTRRHPVHPGGGLISPRSTLSGGSGAGFLAVTHEGVTLTARNRSASGGAVLPTAAIAAPGLNPVPQLAAAPRAVDATTAEEEQEDVEEATQAAAAAAALQQPHPQLAGALSSDSGSHDDEEDDDDESDESVEDNSSPLSELSRERGGSSDESVDMQPGDPTMFGPPGADTSL